METMKYLDNQNQDISKMQKLKRTDAIQEGDICINNEGTRFQEAWFPGLKVRDADPHNRFTYYRPQLINTRKTNAN